MLTHKWIDPRGLDWTDPFNPLLGRGWGPDPSRNPYMYDTLSDPIWVAIRHMQNAEPRAWVVPDPIDAVIMAGSTYEAAVAIEPNTWLLGINTWIAPGEDNDFYVQITDSSTGKTLFSQQARASNLAPAVGATASHDGLIYWLSTPKFYLPPAYPSVRIVNLANSALKCNVNLFCAVETR